MPYDFTYIWHLKSKIETIETRGSRGQSDGPRGAGAGGWVRGTKIEQHRVAVTKQSQDVWAAQDQSQQHRRQAAQEPGAHSV